MLIASFSASYFSSAKTKLPPKSFCSVFCFRVLSLSGLSLNTSLISALFFATTFFLPHVGIFASLVSYYLWNEAITLIGTQKRLDLLFNPSFSELLLLLNQAIVLTQIISIIIITGLLLTNKKA
jgi:drug/metabolite transporter (DMT)-like permease